MPKQGRRRLAAIMFTDIVGYSRAMQEDEARGRLLRERHKQVFEQCTSRFSGRIVQYFGDGTLSVFDSAVSAVECAVCMQKNLKTYPQVPLRIGIHLGDIHYDETEVYGHGVNVAARIEPVCNPGGVFISNKVFDEIQNHPWLDAKPIGVFGFKNIDQELSLFAVKAKDVTMPNAEDIAKIREVSRKVEFSSSSMQSSAIQRFVRDKRRERRKKVGRVAALTLVAMLAVAAVARIGFKNVTPPEPVADGRESIAVLPFTNMTMGQENEYFSDGMTEDILTKLSKIDRFSVTSRTSVMQYKSTGKSTRQIARELGVDHILEGSVRRDGDMVRITAQLIDARNDSHIWAQTYDEQLTNIFDVQSQVAADIAEQLEVELSDEDFKKIGPDRSYDIAAYDEYLHGREYYHKYNNEANDKAINHFKKALEIEPEMAYAYAGLGDAYAQRANFNGMDPTILDTAVIMSAKAIELDPGLSEGYKALGLAFHYQQDFDAAVVQYEKALELDPYNDMAANNLGMIEKQKGDIAGAAKWAKKTLEIGKNVPSSSANMAGLYMEVGDDETAAQIIDEGLEANPEAAELQAMKGEVKIRMGQYGEAEQVAQEVIQLAPDEAKGYDLLGNVYMYEGKWGDAAKSFKTAKERSVKDAEKVRYDAMVTFVEHKEKGTHGDSEVWVEILRDLDELEADNEHYAQTAALIRAAVQTQRGDYDQAVKCIEKASKYHWIDYKSGMSHPAFAELKNLPDFQQLMDELKHKSDSIRTEVIAVTKQDGT